jgi:hypothetical protein
MLCMVPGSSTAREISYRHHISQKKSWSKSEFIQELLVIPWLLLHDGLTSRARYTHSDNSAWSRSCHVGTYGWLTRGREGHYCGRWWQNAIILSWLTHL